MKIPPKYFEDFEVGYSFETKPTLISKEEIVNFASKYDPQLFHLNSSIPQAPILVPSKIPVINI